MKVQGEHNVLSFSVAEEGPRNPQGRLNAPLGSLEWVARYQLGEEEEIPVTREQRVDAVRDANRRDACIVDDPAYHIRTVHDPLQNFNEVVGFADHVVRRRICPSHELAPSMVGRGRLILPDAAVCDHAHELVAARPRDGPSFVALGESNHDVVRRLAQTRFSSVRVNEYVGIDRDQGVPGSL